MNNFYIYFLIDPLKKLPFYIGKGKGRRAYKHLSENKNNTENKKKYAYIKGLRNKGQEPFVDFIFKDLDETLAYTIETNLIKFYGRKDIDENGILTNICPDNRPPSPKGRPKTTNAVEAARKVGLSNKGKKRSQEFKDNLSRPRNKKSAKKTHEYQLKYRAKKVLCVEKGIIFESLHSAQKKIKASSISTISNCAKGKHKTAYGYTWRFIGADGQIIHPKLKKRGYKSSKAIMCIETGEIFRSIKDAAKKFNINRPYQISDFAKGKRTETVSGFTWKFINEK